MSDKTYDNTNRAALFQNRKKKSDKSPDRTGKINFDGSDCQLSAWERWSQSEGDYLALKANVYPPEHNSIVASGTLQLVTDKKTDASPDATGEIVHEEGPFRDEVWKIAAWKATSQKTGPFLRLALTPPEDSAAPTMTGTPAERKAAERTTSVWDSPPHPEQSGAGQQGQQTTYAVDDDDEIPF